MKLVRRAFYVDEVEDKRAGQVAWAVMASKSEIVSLALAKGLDQLEVTGVSEIMDEIKERRLRLMGKGSIKPVGVKRRAK